MKYILTISFLLSATLTAFSQEHIVTLPTEPRELIESVDNCDINRLIIAGDISWLKGNESSLFLTSEDGKTVENTGDLNFDISEIVSETNVESGKKDVVFTFGYAAADQSGPWQNAINKSSPPKLILQLNNCKVAHQDDEANAQKQEEFNKAVAEKLETYYKFSKYAKKGLYERDSVVYIFIDAEGGLIEGTKFPTSLKEKDAYQYKIVAFVDLTLYTSKNFRFEIFGSEFRSINDFIIGSGELVVASAFKAADLDVIESKVSGPFSDAVYFRVYRREDKDQEFNKVVFDRHTALEDNRPYHVSILGGFYYSSLNDPGNVVKDVLPNSTDSSLYADNSNSQRALTVMAVFYPATRNPDYNYKNLGFGQKLGFAFGVKLSEDLFDDLLLGVNYEFSKGGNFTVGVHYGKHNTIRGYSDFRFGETVYKGNFSNDKLVEQWDFGFFAGVTIDLRVLGALRREAQNQRDANGGTTN